METAVVTMLFCLVAMMFSILLVLSSIVKTLRRSDESLSKIAKHLEQNGEEKGN